jgi:hypothetical protein
MNVQINQLVKSLLQKDSLDQCSVQELKQFAERHPYFGAAQLLLTKKLQTENDVQYNEQLQKTFLFFHNPLWVEQLLNETGNATIKKPDQAVADEMTIPAETAIENKEPEIASTVVETTGDRSGDLNINLQDLMPKPEDPAKTELIFEPFHTVDYFASQGIKFKEEEKPKDKFGQQLKSFTDWLKSMKRLPLAEIAAAVETKPEQKIDQLAENSLQNRDVVTETMAEVWDKQGNTEKAIDIYNKLSLLDPSKSPYFAAKIEELKKRI